jgi:hypothetical protein
MKPKSCSNSKPAGTQAKPRGVSPSYPGVVRGPTASKVSERGTELPHERDETTGPRRRNRRDPVVEQAYRDVKNGQLDTDLRETSTRVFKRAAKASRAR